MTRGEEGEMPPFGPIRTVDVMFGGRGFVIAFRSEDDARRFMEFLEQYEREVGLDGDWTSVYVLDPEWVFGYWSHVPEYAAWGIEPDPILRMIAELVEVRLAKRPGPQPVPRLDMEASKTLGATFALNDMPPAPLLN